MSVEEIKALERRFFEELNKGKEAGIAVLDELVATDIVFHSGRVEDNFFLSIKARLQV